eukprot:9829153-Alexandrium_andersonii.AAC.1
MPLDGFRRIARCRPSKAFGTSGYGLLLVTKRSAVIWRGRHTYAWSWLDAIGDPDSNQPSCRS